MQSLGRVARKLILVSIACLAARDAAAQTAPLLPAAYRAYDAVLAGEPGFAGDVDMADLPAADPSTTDSATAPAAAPALVLPRESYAGVNADGVPNYVRRPFTLAERAMLRERFGIDDPSRLYLSDSTETAYLTYDTRRDPGARVVVPSHRVGAPSVRLPGETWEQAERRVRAMRPDDFPASVRTADTTLASLHPAARPHFERMLADARKAGFRLRVVETHRAPERQAYLFSLGGGRTYTLTSRHSDGRAIDVIVDDGNLKRAQTRRNWIAFRRWVQEYDNGRFRIIGTPEHSWDWPHVELRGEPVGYRSIEELFAAPW